MRVNWGWIGGDLVLIGVNEVTLQSNEWHLLGGQYLWLAARQFLAQNFQKEGTTAVMQNMRKQTSNVHVNKSRVKKNSGILFTRFQDKTKKSFACITKIDLGRVKVISLYKLLQLETSIRSLISQKNNFDTWKKKSSSHSSNNTRKGKSGLCAWKITKPLLWNK